MTTVKTDSGLTLLRKDIYIPGKKEFVVSENFKEGEENDGVPINRLGSLFKKELLPLTERNIKPITTGRIHELDERLHHQLVLNYLGGMQVVKVNLYHFYEFLKTVSPDHYFAYINDSFAVAADWDFIDGGWVVEARLANHWFGCGRGRRVFSGNFDSHRSRFAEYDMQYHILSKEAD